MSSSSSSSADSATVAYNFSIVAVQAEDGQSVDYDVFFFTEKSKKLMCVRVTNVYLHFLLHRIPGLTIEQTKRYVEEAIANIKFDKLTLDFKIEIVTNLRDSCYTNLDTKNPEYVKIYSKNPYLLRVLIDRLQSKLILYYQYLNIDRLDEFDKLFVRNTETPFRNTFYSANSSKVAYEFSKIFSIPFVGWNKISLDKLEKENKTYSAGSYLSPNMRKVEKTYIISANVEPDYHNKEVFKYFHSWKVPADYKQNEMNNITLMGYDIETYNKNAIPNPSNPNQYIFCVGFSFFKLTNPKPYKRFCILSKDMKMDEKIKDKLEEVDLKKWMYKDCINDTGKTHVYIVREEYKPDEKDILYKNKDFEHYLKEYDPSIDFTTYICVPNEEELIRTFLKISIKEVPHIILTFNGWNFDSIWIKSRLDKYKLFDLGLELYSIYDVGELSDDKCKNAKVLQNYLPKWKKFPFKLEGKLQLSDNYAMRTPVFQSMDVYKIILKADAKKFSQSGKLDYMLEQYHINNPFNGKPLSKTGLSITEMFNCWDENKEFYEIGKYCSQDAWICTTLIVERVVIIDKLAMASVTMTSLEDSIYLADGHRVSVLNSYYGYHNNFAYMDEGFAKRKEIIDKNWALDENYKIRGLGQKTFDSRTVIGGAVANYHCWRGVGVVAADYSAQYPAQFRSCNVASNTFVDKEMIEHPEKFGLELVEKVQISDMYIVGEQDKRNIYYFKHVDKKQ